MNARSKGSLSGGDAAPSASSGATLLRALTLALLIMLSSLLAGVSLGIMGGGIMLLPAILLVWPIASLQRKQWPQLRNAPYWVSGSLMAAFVGAIAAPLLVQRCSHTQMVRLIVQPVAVAFGMGLLVGIAQCFSMRTSAKRKWLWLVFTTLAYTVGAGVVELFRGLLPGLIFLGYALVLGAVGAMILVYSDCDGEAAFSMSVVPKRRVSRKA
jgi:hypothetical protein